MVELIVGVLLFLALICTWIHVSAIQSLLKKRAKEERDEAFAANRQLKRVAELLEEIARGGGAAE